MEQVSLRSCIMIDIDNVQFFVDDLCALKSNPLIKGTVSVSLVNS